MYHSVAEQPVSHEIKDLFESPKVYLYTGGPAGFASVYNPNDFIEVKLLDGSYIVDDYKKKTFNVNATLELPNRNTLRLW